MCERAETAQRTPSKVSESTREFTSRRENPQSLREIEKAGWGTWIRTRTNGVRVRGSTVNLFPSRDRLSADGRAWRVYRANCALLKPPIFQSEASALVFRRAADTVVPTKKSAPRCVQMVRAVRKEIKWKTPGAQTRRRAGPPGKAGKLIPASAISPPRQMSRQIRRRLSLGQRRGSLKRIQRKNRAAGAGANAGNRAMRRCPRSRRHSSRLLRQNAINAGEGREAPGQRTRPPLRPPKTQKRQRLSHPFSRRHSPGPISTRRSILAPTIAAC